MRSRDAAEARRAGPGSGMAWVVPTMIPVSAEALEMRTRLPAVFVTLAQP
jgi:hypothetical protein